MKFVRHLPKSEIPIFVSMVVAEVFSATTNTAISKKETIAVLSGYFHFGKYHYGNCCRFCNN